MPTMAKPRRRLTFAEEAEEPLISVIQPVMAAKILKFVIQPVSGHVAFVDRCGSVCAVATTLPRLAADVEVLALER